MTPRKLDALIHRWEHAQEHTDAMLAQIAQVSANFSFRAPEKLIPIEAFMPHADKRTDEEKQALEQDLFTATFTHYLLSTKAIQERGKNAVTVTVPKGSKPEEELDKLWE